MSLNMSESKVLWLSSHLFCADEVSLQNIARSRGRSRDRGAHGCLAWCRWCCSTARNAANAAGHQGATATIGSCRSCWNFDGSCQRSWKSAGKLGLSNQKGIARINKNSFIATWKYLGICFGPYPALTSARHFFSSTLPQKPLVAFCMCPSVAICTDFMPRECKLSTAAATESSVVMSLPLLLASSCTFRTSSWRWMLATAAQQVIWSSYIFVVYSRCNLAPVSSSPVDGLWLRMLLRPVACHQPLYFTQCCKSPNFGTKMRVTQLLDFSRIKFSTLSPSSDPQPAVAAWLEPILLRYHW